MFLIRPITTRLRYWAFADFQARRDKVVTPKIPFF